MKFFISLLKCFVLFISLKLKHSLILHILSFFIFQKSFGTFFTFKSHLIFPWILACVWWFTFLLIDFLLQVFNYWFNSSSWFFFCKDFLISFKYEDPVILMCGNVFRKGSNMNFYARFGIFPPVIYGGIVLFQFRKLKSYYFCTWVESMLI